jgi:prepilin-type processing-associated H-X9-DG protein
LQFGAPHTGGLNAVFADGSVHSINFDIDIVVFYSLGTRNGYALNETSDTTGVNLVQLEPTIWRLTHGSVLTPSKKPSKVGKNMSTMRNSIPILRIQLQINTKAITKKLCNCALK